MNITLCRKLILIAVVLLLSLTGCRQATEETFVIPLNETVNAALSAKYVGVNGFLKAGEYTLADQQSTTESETGNQDRNYFIPKPDSTLAANEADGENELSEKTETDPEGSNAAGADAPNVDNISVKQAESSASRLESLISTGLAASAVNPPAAEPAASEYVLVITGNGVAGETTWTLDQLKSLRDGYHDIRFSTTNNRPSFGYVSAEGISLPYLLIKAGMTNDAAGFRLVGSDGNHAFVTYDQMFGNSYSYGIHDKDGSWDLSSVVPMIAWNWIENGIAGDGTLRSFFGQNGSMDINTSVSINNLCQIEVSTVGAGSWAAPVASIASGSSVSPGQELELGHNNLDLVHIYYTLDGSEPNYNSKCYNLSTSYQQPQLIKPFILTEDVTIKAFAAAYGKERSPVATFYYTIEQ